MSSTLGVVLLLAAFIAAILYRAIAAFIDPLGKIPGPRFFGLTRWRLAYEDWEQRRTRTIHSLHAQYGPVIRIGPQEIHFNSPSALRTIYGPGSGFGRTEFYRMFDVYGRQNLFTFGNVATHGGRKKLLANAYSKSVLLRGDAADEIEQKVGHFMNLVHETAMNGKGMETFRTLHWYSLDNITAFLYGQIGGTNALSGSLEDRALLDDILDPARRPLTWRRVHFPALTAWLYKRTGIAERLVKPFLPMQKPATYTGLRAHAWKVVEKYSAALATKQVAQHEANSLISKLWAHHKSRKEDGGLDNVDIASECADHFLAGIDTTSDTLMFLIWVLSLPENHIYQERIIEEARNITLLNAAGNPKVEAADKLPYLDAVIKETLRLYAPLPASEPRSSPVTATIDGFVIPAGTTVSMSPYSLHRNPDVFRSPLRWDPDRWLGNDEAQLAQMKKWWWAFSSGGRMCIGMHLAMAEMVALVPAIYRRYKTRIMPGFEGVSPGITSRFEVFYDERFEKVQEHTCWIQFNPLAENGA